MPQRAYLAQSLLEGRLPLWNPFIFLGAPFLANPQTAVLYPPSWLFVAGSVERAYSGQLVLHTFLAALFMFLLGRHALRAGTISALVGALAYGFGGFMVGQTGHLNQLSAAAWLPALLWCYDRAVAHRSPAWAGLGALALGAQLLAGHPQETYMSVLTLVLFGLIRAPWRDLPWLAWAGAAGVLIGVAGGLIAAAQLLPTLELAPLSIRGGGVQWADAVAGSVPPYLMPRSLFPPYWLEVASTEFLGYIGVVPVTLGFLALVVARSRYVLFGAVLCFIALFLAPGENNGNYWPLWHFIPGFDTFRVPARWLFLWGFGAATLATLGAAWIEQGARVGLRVRRDLWPRAVLVALVLAAGLSWQIDAGEPFPSRRTPIAYLTLAAVGLAAGSLATLRRPQLAAGLLVGMSAVELWAAADSSPARQAPPANLLATPSAVERIRADGASYERLLSVAQPTYVPSDEIAQRALIPDLPDRVQVGMLVANKWRESMNPNQPLQYRVPSADGYDGGVLPMLRFVRFSGLLVPPPNEARPDGVLISRVEQPPGPRLLDHFGVRYVAANRDDARVEDGQTILEGDVRLDRRDTPFAAHSLLLFRADTADDDAALERMASPIFDPNADLLLANPLAPVLNSSRAGQVIQAEVRTPELWRARVSVPERAYLLQREAWYPGWKARVDGVPVAVERANVLYRAILIEPGDHVVEFAFESDSLARGAVLSAVGLLLAVVMLSWPIWRRVVPMGIFGRRGNRA